MQTTIDRSSFASYSQTQSSFATSSFSYRSTVQSSSSKSLSTGFRESGAGNQQISLATFSQQSSRSPKGMSASISAVSFQHVSGRNDRSDQYGSRRNNRCNTETMINKNLCGSQKFECSNAQVKNNKRNCNDQQSDWCNTQVQNNKASLDIGNYTVDLNKSDSSLLLTNKQTGSTTKISGDPHIDTNGTSGTFKGSLTFDLPGHTKVTVGTQAQGAVSYADQVTITQGNKAYVVNGLSQIDSSPLTVQSSRNGRQLDRQTPDGYTLVANSSGTGWIDPQTGHAPTAADFSKV
ncbi:DUF1521 domain-containing protein [Paraburkholderia sp. SG-MS1]|uniref:DUF1521 domain-containing protein n=1 Tax=Paraburkholderia sp. SG-MS1 TaxID=2023741 RepID=UPI001445CC8F|nr:DUF1521 domain-containing protein [Paraburkholderia sp. SG-MS1]